jgi:hypothetical protein
MSGAIVVATADVDRIYEGIKGFADGHQNASGKTMTPFVAHGIRVAQQMFADEEGKYKEAALMQAMRRVFKDYVQPDDEVMQAFYAALLVDDGPVSGTIETLIDIAKGRLDIGKGLKQACVGCFGGVVAAAATLA